MFSLNVSLKHGNILINFAGDAWIISELGILNFYLWFLLDIKEVFLLADFI